MLFPEGLPIFHSIGLIVGISSVLFVWRFHVFRKNSIATLISLPSIVVAGAKFSGKTVLIKSITGSETSAHPFEDSFKLSYLKGEKQTLQFIEIPSLVEEREKELQKIKNLNLNSMIYVFDVSENSEPIENQLENFENDKRIFGEIPFIPVASKIDLSENEKVEELKNRFGKVYGVPYVDKGITKDAILKDELKDLSFLIKDLSDEVAKQENGIRTSI
jgi:GTP1/Obg family GTP-binding protein